ncbi:hypothetical protein D3C71_1460870 [compost metagenome]
MIRNKLRRVLRRLRCRSFFRAPCQWHFNPEPLDARVELGHGFTGFVLSLRVHEGGLQRRCHRERQRLLVHPILVLEFLRETLHAPFRQRAVGIAWRVEKNFVVDGAIARGQLTNALDGRGLQWLLEVNPGGRLLLLHPCGLAIDQHSQVFFPRLQAKFTCEASRDALHPCADIGHRRVARVHHHGR